MRAHPGPRCVVLDEVQKVPELLSVVHQQMAERPDCRFLEAISFSHGTPLNLAGVARECQVKRNTVQGYVDVLEDLLLGFRAPVFSRHAKRHLAEHAKFYFFDPGTSCAACARGCP